MVGRRVAALAMTGLVALGPVYIGWSGGGRPSLVLGVLAGGALLAVAVLGGMALWVWYRGGFGLVAGALLRSVAAPVVGLGGWFLAILVVAGVWPALFASAGLAVVASGTAVGLCVFLAWTRRDTSPGLRNGGLAAAVAWALAGAWLGGHAADGSAGAVAAILGAVLAANAALLVLDVALARRAARQPSHAVIRTSVAAAASVESTIASRARGAARS